MFCALALLVVACGHPGCATKKVALDPESAGWSFIDRELLKTDGRIVTYPTDGQPFHQEYGVWPNDILAESMGLALRYFAETDRQDDFKQTWWFVENRMKSKETGLISWKFDATTWKAMPSSAAVDDLRIVRALLMAWKRWGNPEYRNAGLALGEAILKYEVKLGYPVEIASWEGDIVSSDKVDLAYLDLYSMKLLAQVDKRWEPIFKRSRDLIMLSLTKHGLFYDKYDPRTHEFWNQDNNLVNKMMCAIHLAEIGIHEEPVIAFIEGQLYETGKILGRYDAASGQATVEYDAVGVYALALQFAIMYDREALVDTLLEKIEGYQKGDDEGLFKGCFGQGNCHAFDTLNVLLAYRLLPPDWRRSKGPGKR
jgi:hypothetical protein